MFQAAVLYSRRYLLDDNGFSILALFADAKLLLIIWR